MKKLFILLLLAQITFAQKDGFWDKERAFTKEIKLGSGNRTLVKIDDLPEGTSEFVYRISLIDENSKVTTSLASILKAIPDPTGISQGAGGAITLTNSLSGDDTCLYGIYTSEKAGTKFLQDGKLETACHFIKEPVNKDSKVISIKNTKCFDNAPNVWFAFENKNWVMSTKIVLEVVSWIDYNASRGWNATTKKEVLSLIDNAAILKAPINKEKFQGAFLEAFTAKYKYSEFKQMLPIEKNRVVEVLSEESLKKSGQLDKYLTYFREDIRMLSFSNRDDEAIKKYITQVFEKKWATDKDYDLLGNLYLKTKQFQKAEEFINKAISLNKNEIGYQLHLANVCLYTDKVSEAKEIHKNIKNQNIDANTSWVQATKNNFDNMKKVGLPTDNFKKILRILE